MKLKKLASAIADAIIQRNHFLGRCKTFTTYPLNHLPGGAKGWVNLLAVVFEGRIYKSIFLLPALFLSIYTFAQDGQQLFKERCAACHTITATKLVGPGLQDINNKRSQEWLISWIKDSQALIKSGDADAIAVFNDYNKSVMPPFALSDPEIIAILNYIEAGPQPKTPPPAEANNTDAATTMSTTQKGNADIPVYYLIGAGILLLFAVYIIVVARKSIMAYKTRNGESIENITTSESIRYWITNNRKWVAIGSLVVFIFLLKGGWDSLAKIGVAQGYEPVQPIQFSHKIHAGQNGISCVYCHSGAQKGKTAGIPSANVCMNCHTYVKEGRITGTTEIAKIYTALDYDPQTMSYGDNPKPIQWIKVHNLPDLAYFNHSQHVVAGQVECQTCHGPVEEMSVVRQESPLTMGWCVNCHRETEVKMASNEYYEKLHSKLKEKYNGEKITVERIGGLDCAKCHY